MPHFETLVEMGHQLIFADQRGGGRSVDPFIEETINLNTLVDDIDRLRAQLGLNRINILGHSFGGLLAVKYAIKYGNHLNKMVLCNCSPFQKHIIHKVDEIRSRRITASGNPLTAFFHDESKINQLHAGPFFMNEKYYGITSKKLGEEGYRTVENVNFAEVTVPSLIIHGEYDFIPYEASQHAAKQIPNSKLHIVKDSGHFSFIEKNDEVCQLVDGFLSAGIVR